MLKITFDLTRCRLRLPRDQEQSDERQDRRCGEVVADILQTVVLARYVAMYGAARRSRIPAKFEESELPV